MKALQPCHYYYVSCLQGTIWSKGQQDEQMTPQILLGSNAHFFAPAQALPTAQLGLHGINHNALEFPASAERRGLVDGLAFAASSSIAVIARCWNFVSRPQWDSLPKHSTGAVRASQVMGK